MEHQNRTHPTRATPTEGEVMKPTNKDLLTAIRTHCKKCFPDAVRCQETTCPLWAYRHESAAVQTDIFRTEDKELFFMRVMEAARSFGPNPFFWSELRDRVKLRPLHRNWYGIATRIMKSHGFKIIDGAEGRNSKAGKAVLTGNGSGLHK